MPRGRIWVAVATGIIVVAYALGSIYWVQANSEWYDALDSPPWQPPDVLFGIAWTYNFMAIVAAGIGVTVGGSTRQTWAWLLALAISVVAALSWAWLFYADHSLWAAGAALAIATAVTVVAVVAAWQSRAWAGAILLPYVVWLALATSLAFGYAARNS
jgi:tryptophan-rich sensory protein